ncbi:MAG TPA: NAD-dependent epimerase/dehydratase family protein [bacterium]|nr:NAD-dependent epimerase/dehydratase family protein [bacterium]
MNTDLVTGVTGFTGGHLARYLLNKGRCVRGLALPGIDTNDLEKDGIEIIAGDLTKPDTLKRAIRGVDRVYHIAAVYREQDVPRKHFFEVNVGGTRNLLEVAKGEGVGRVIHCSTVGVQGEIADPPATEETPCSPGDYYQESKLEGERLALEYAKAGLPLVVFRPVGIYGPGDDRFLKLFRFIQKGKFRMLGSGRVLYHLTYIDDLVEGIYLVGQKPNIEGEIFTLAGDRYTTLNELVAVIAEVLGVEISLRRYPVWPVWIVGALCEMICTPLRIQPPIYRRRVDFFIKDRAFDITKAKTRLGYAPRVDLKTGLSRTAQWYKEQGLIE